MDHLIKLRYYPGDPLKPIVRGDLDRIADSTSVNIKLEEVKLDVQENEEKTLDKDLDSISQTIITISGSEADDVRNALANIISAYRSPRTVFSLWGSNETGEKIAWETIEEMDGWW